MVQIKKIKVHLEKNLIDLLVGTGRDLSLFKSNYYGKGQVATCSF